MIHVIFCPGGDDLLFVDMEGFQHIHALGEAFQIFGIKGEYYLSLQIHPSENWMLNSWDLNPGSIDLGSDSLITGRTWSASGYFYCEGWQKVRLCHSVRPIR